MEKDCVCVCVLLFALLVAGICNGNSTVTTARESDISRSASEEREAVTKSEMDKSQTEIQFIDREGENKLPSVTGTNLGTVNVNTRDSTTFTTEMIDNRMVKTNSDANTEREILTNNVTQITNSEPKIKKLTSKTESPTSVNAITNKKIVQKETDSGTSTFDPTLKSDIFDNIATGEETLYSITGDENASNNIYNLSNETKELKIALESSTQKEINTNNSGYNMLFQTLTSNSSTMEVRNVNANLTKYKYINNKTPSCNRMLSVVINESRLLENGSLLALDDSQIMYPPGYFWEELNKNNVTETWGCICLLINCMRKCCPEGMTSLPKLSSKTSECDYSNNSLLKPFSPEFVDENTNQNVNNSNFYVLYGNPCPFDSYRLEPDTSQDDYFILYHTGHLVIPALGKNLNVDAYCVEAFDDVNAILPLVCYDNNQEELTPKESTEEIFVIYPIGMVISIPFLLATCFVYAAIPELRNLHGKSLMSQVSSLCTAYVFLTIVQIGGQGLTIGFCVASAFIIFFSFHANFFWLNVMCFDIWWTFSGLRPLRGSVKEREFKKFVMYSCYAWGSPFIMLLVCIAMDFAPGIPDSYIKPMFGVKKCWFKGDDAALAYFFGPIGVLILCNLILFIATAFKIVSLKKETRMLKGQESKRHDQDAANQQRFNLYLKLFIVMGVNWIMEVISFAAGGPNYLWYITDLGNTLQGLLIFVIFVCKSKIRRLLAKRFCRKSSTYSSSTRSHPTPSRTSSYNYTQRTSVTSHDHMPMKSVGTYRNTDVP